MADELAGLGLNWQDENLVRRNIAATMQARSSDEAVADEDRVTAAWANISNAEESLQSLTELPAADRPSDFSTRVAAAERAVTQAAKALKDVQLDVERRAKERLAAAKRSEMERDVARQRESDALRARMMDQETAVHLMYQQRQQQQTRSSSSNSMWSAAPPSTSHHSLSSTPSASRHQQQQGGGAADDAFYQKRVLQHMGVSRPLSGSTARSRSSAGGAGGGGSKSNPIMVTDAVDSYRGGELLPAVHHVSVSRTDRVKYAANNNNNNKRPRVDSTKDEEENQEEVEDRVLAAVKRETANQQQQQGEADEDRMVTPVGHLPMYTIAWTTYRRLLGYQKEGLYWLLELHHRRIGGILGDEMGLGKTVQIAVLLNALLTSGALKGPALIVAPLTVLSQWQRELRIWAPKLETLILHGVTGDRPVEDVIRSSRNRPVALITTYTTMTLQVASLQTCGPQYIILDEGHKISNPMAACTMAAKSFLSPHRLILSGSPIQNSLQELWCLFDFCVPQMLGTMAKFTDEFAGPINASKNHRATAFEVATAIECAKVLRAYIQPFLLRRLKRDVNAMLPQKHERVIRCPLTNTQLDAYVEVLTSNAVQSLVGNASLRRFDTGGIDKYGRDSIGHLWSGPQASTSSRGVSHMQRNEAYKILHSLRQLCNHADIYFLKQDDMTDGGTGKDVRFRSNRAVRYEGSSKLSALRSLLQQWRAGGHKVLVFSQYRMMLDIIENMCEQEGHTYIRMDGETASRDRGILIDKFNQEESIFVALLTTKVGGLGVNLTGADRVVLFDPDWNPATDEQARERAWRIGQRREVCIYRMIASGTIEETILHRQLAKTYVTEKVLSDPTLQRSFSSHSFVEAFFLGTEYSTRVAPGKRHVISAVCDLAIAESEAEFQREVKNEEQLEADAVKREQEIGHVVGATAEVLQTPQRRERQQQEVVTVKREPGTAAGRSSNTSNNSATTRTTTTSQQQESYQFTIENVKQEDSATNNNNATTTGSGELASFTNLLEGRGEGSDEALLFQRLTSSHGSGGAMGGRAVSSGTWTLARASAQNVLARAVGQ